MKAININIWDDYNDGEETYAYVEENNMKLSFQKKILEFMFNKLNSGKLQMALELFDSKVEYPNAPIEYSFVRWQITFYNLRHSEIENIINSNLCYLDAIDLNIYSES
jgi:hypothetical protein